MASYGFGALNKNLNTKNDYNLKNNLGFTISTGRVINIILDGDDYNAIGTIEYVNIESSPADISNINPQVNKFTAKPLLSNIKNYPLINELVLIWLNSMNVVRWLGPLIWRPVLGARWPLQFFRRCCNSLLFLHEEVRGMESIWSPLTSA